MIEQKNDLRFSKRLFIDKSEGDILKSYEVLKSLGKGSYGRVYEVKNKITGEIRACKQLSKGNIKNLEKFNREIEIMKKTDHPNIVKLYEIFENERYFYLIMEECKGGELFDMIINHIQSNEMYTEKEAAIIFKQLMSAIACCHVNKICHRDLKPENILFSKKENDSPIKVIDFGLSRIWNNPKMTTKVGTAYYVSPEVLHGSYNEKCDVWSAGVILYILLGGDPPFNGSNDYEIYKKIIKGKFEFPENKWKNVSKNAIDLIKKMLCPENTRLSAEQVLAHPWLKIIESKEKFENLTSNVSYIKKYAHANNMKKIILTYIASRLNDDEVKELQKLFDSIDLNHDGVISFKEFEGVFDKFHSINHNELKDMFNSIDTNKNGVISYTEFLACTIDQHLYLKEQRLFEAFKAIDKDGNGKIDKKELKTILKIDDEEKLESLVKSFDLNQDGAIDYNELLDYMRNDDQKMLLDTKQFDPKKFI